MNYNFKNYDTVQQFLYNAHAWQISVLCIQVPRRDVTSLTTYMTHTRVSDTRIYIAPTRGKAIRHRDGPTGHKNIFKQLMS